MSGTVAGPGQMELPATLPIFPLTGVLLLPRGKLPLNIFEPRYLNMVRDALAGDRMIGMVQPRDDDPATLTGPPEGAAPLARLPAVYPTGCAGRITAFSESDDGRFHITLTGVARFEIREEVPTLRGYRRVVPDWDRYRADLADDEAAIDRPRRSGKTSKEGMDVDPKLLEILVCPLTKGPLRYDRAAQELVSEEAGLAYPIRDGIPIMLVDEARPLSDDERAAFKAQKPPVAP